jgi:hypothetical protein
MGGCPARRLLPSSARAGPVESRAYPQLKEHKNLGTSGRRSSASHNTIERNELE